MGDKFTRVEFQIRKPDGSGWHTMGTHDRTLPVPGSLSNDTPHGREMYMFGWYNGDGPGVWVSRGGIDEQITEPDEEGKTLNKVSSIGIEKVADLSEKPYSMLHSRAHRPSVTVRFRAV